MRPSGAGKRSGFTLIELLTVIAIIGVLAALLIVAVIPMINKGPDALDAADISNLAISVNNFKAKYNVYPPSKIVLYPNFNYYNTAVPLEAESLYYINQIWQRISTQPTAVPPPAAAPNTFYYNALSPSYKKSNYQWVPGVATPAAGYTLEGDQCLVFFLGGPAPTINGIIDPQGFSTNPQDPCGAGTDRTRFHQFQAARLKDRSGLGFPSYLNNWSQTANYFVYFSSGKRKNGYNSGGLASHEIAALDGVAPYFDAFLLTPAAIYTITDYLNPTTFQIISAGLDGRFTELGRPYPLSSPKVAPQRCNWKTGAISTDPTLFWKDNRSNFTSNQLQVP